MIPSCSSGISTGRFNGELNTSTSSSGSLEDIRRRLYEMKGNSRIMSAFHDFSGDFKCAV